MGRGKAASLEPVAEPSPAKFSASSGGAIDKLKKTGKANWKKAVVSDSFNEKLYEVERLREVHAIEEEKGAFLQALDDLSDGSDDETEGGELDGDASFDNSIEKAPDRLSKLDDTLRGFCVTTGCRESELLGLLSSYVQTQPANTRPLARVEMTSAVTLTISVESNPSAPLAPRAGTRASYSAGDGSHTSRTPRPPPSRAGTGGSSTVDQSCLSMGGSGGGGVSAGSTRPGTIRKGPVAGFGRGMKPAGKAVLGRRAVANAAANPASSPSLPAARFAGASDLVSALAVFDAAPGNTGSGGFIAANHPVLQAAVKSLTSLKQEFDGRVARRASKVLEEEDEQEGEGRMSGTKARRQVLLLREQIFQLSEKRKEEITAKLAVQKQSWQRLIQGQAMEELTQQLMGEVSQLDDANTRNEADLAATADTLAVTHTKLVAKSEAYSKQKVALTRLTASEKTARADLKELKHSLAEAVVKLEFEKVDLAKTKLIADKVPILQNELEAARLKNHYLERALRDTVTEMSGVRDELTASEVQARKYLMTVERLQDEASTLRSVVTDLEEEGKVKSDRLRASQTTCGEVNLQLEITQGQLAEACKQVEALEAELAGSRKDYARMVKMYEEEVHARKSVEQALASSKAQLNAVAELCLRVFNFMKKAVPHGGATQSSVARFQASFDDIITQIRSEQSPAHKARLFGSERYEPGAHLSSGERHHPQGISQVPDAAAAAAEAKRARRTAARGGGQTAEELASARQQQQQYGTGGNPNGAAVSDPSVRDPEPWVGNTLQAQFPRRAGAGVDEDEDEEDEDEEEDGLGGGLEGDNEFDEQSNWS